MDNNIFTNIRDMRETNGSVYVIDENNNLYVSGNNENGILGLGKPDLNFDDFILVERLEGRVASVNIDSNSKESYDFVTLTTTDGEVYIAGNYNGVPYNRWINKKDIYGIENIKFKTVKPIANQTFKSDIEIAENDWTTLFHIDSDQKFAFELFINSQRMIGKLLISTFGHNEEDIRVYKEYMISTSNLYTLRIVKYQLTKEHTNYEDITSTRYAIQIKFKHSTRNIDDVLDEEALKFKVINYLKCDIHFNELDLSKYEYQYEVDEVLNDDINATFDTGNNIESTSATNALAKNYRISLDLSDIMNNLDLYNNGSAFFLYPLFSNMGLIKNRFYKFDGSLIVNDMHYRVNALRLLKSNETKQGINSSEKVEFGPIEFMLDKNNKLYEAKNGKPLIEDKKFPAFTIRFNNIIENKNKVTGYENPFKKNTILPILSDHPCVNEILKDEIYINTKYLQIAIGYKYSAVIADDGIHIIENDSCRVKMFCSNAYFGEQKLSGIFAVDLQDEDGFIIFEEETKNLILINKEGIILDTYKIKANIDSAYSRKDCLVMSNESKTYYYNASYDESNNTYSIKDYSKTVEKNSLQEEYSRELVINKDSDELKKYKFNLKDTDEYSVYISSKHAIEFIFIVEEGKEYGSLYSISNITANNSDEDYSKKEEVYINPQKLQRIEGILSLDRTIEVPDYSEIIV